MIARLPDSLYQFDIEVLYNLVRSSPLFFLAYRSQHIDVRQNYETKGRETKLDARRRLLVLVLWCGKLWILEQDGQRKTIIGPSEEHLGLGHRKVPTLPFHSRS